MSAKPDWQELARFAVELAHAAAREILPHFRRSIPIDVKAGEVWDPVTEADRAGERVMRAMIEQRFPDHGINGEEYGVKPARSAFTWVLDPVDGTRAFICGMPTWATLIGLSEEAMPRIGVMHQPHADDLFLGVPGGATLTSHGETRPLRVRAGRPLAEAVFTTTAPELYRSEKEKAALRRMTDATRLTRYGGDAYFFCLLAAGHIDIAMDARMQAYDIAPLLPIVWGAGGHAATWERGDPALGGDVVTAATPELLEAALGLIGA